MGLKDNLGVRWEVRCYPDVVRAVVFQDRCTEKSCLTPQLGIDQLLDNLSYPSRSITPLTPVLCFLQVAPTYSPAFYEGTRSHIAVVTRLNQRVTEFKDSISTRGNVS